MSAKKRMMSELRNYENEKQKDDTIRMETVDGDVLHLKAFMQGVPGTPYEGGTFQLDIQIGEDYPLQPPTIKFLTKIWHPSVNPFDGTVCFPKSGQNLWPVAMSIHKVLISIQSWMWTIRAQDPIDVEILNQAMVKPTIFKKTAEFWTIRFAGARKPFNRECQMKVQLLSRYTANEEPAILVLSYHDWKLPEGNQIS